MHRKFCYPFATAPSDGTGGGAPAAAAGTPAATTPAASTPAGTPAAATDSSKGGSEGKPGDQAGGATTPPKAPDKYELTIPAGGEQYLGSEDLTYIEGVARESGWTNDEAQAEIASAVARSQAREEAASAKLLADFKADKDYGGANLEQTQQLSKRAIDRIFPDGHRLREPLLSTLGRKTVANNVTIVAFLAEVGRLMGEDTPGATRAGGAATGTGDQAKADKFYDHPTSKALADKK